MVGICITPNNCGMEAMWRWDRHGISRETPLGETLTLLFLQVGLALYLGDMLKTMVGASKKLEADLAMVDHPNAFPSTPKATTTTEWDLLQTHWPAK